MTDVLTNNPFTEKFNVNALEKVRAENHKNVQTNAFDLIKNNVDFFSMVDDDKDKRDKIANRTLSRFGLRGYTSVTDIVAACNNSSKNQEIAKSDLESLTESVFIAMNMSVNGDQLITDNMSADQIDEALPEKMKGIGKEIKKRVISDDDRENLVIFNKKIDELKLFTTANVNTRTENYKQWGEAAKIKSPLVKQYLQVSRLVLADLGVKNVTNRGPNIGESDENVFVDGAFTSPPMADIGDAGDAGGSAGGGRERGGISYGPEMPDFSKLVMRSKRTDLRLNMPPKWFNEADHNEQLWYEMADTMSAYAENKTGLKDSIKGLERLWFDDNYRLKLNEFDFMVMYDREGFRMAAEKMVKDLCVLKPDKDNPNGSSFLFLNMEPLSNFKNEKGNFVPQTEMNLNDIDDYKKNIALYICKQKAYGGDQNYEQLFTNEINDIMHLYGKTKDQATEKWEELHKFNDAQIETGTAWNFLYSCDMVESGDFDRKLKPIDGVRGDTINFIFHPKSKMDSKIGATKSDGTDTTGEEEIKGGPLSDWYLYQFSHDSNFRQEYLDGKYNFFPKRLAVGFLDKYAVFSKETGKKMSMAEALMTGQTIDRDRLPYGGSTKWNMYLPQKDLLESSLNIFKYLIGEVPLDLKSFRQWAVGINNAAGLYRQQYTMPDGKILPVLEDKNILEGIIYSSCGVAQSDDLLTLNTPFKSYKEGVRQLVMNSFIKSSVNLELNKFTSKDGPTVFQKQVFDELYKGPIKRAIGELT